MENKPNPKRNFFRKLHDKYRLVIMNDDTFEEKLSFRLTRFNVFIFFGTLSIFLVIATIYLIAFTPLREYIPGYADFNTRQVLRELMQRTDSLETDLRQKDLYIMNIRNIVEGREVDFSPLDTITPDAASIIEDLPRSREDSLLRVEMESLLAGGGWITEDIATGPRISHFFYFPPVSGVVTNYFNPAEGHYGVDVVAEENAPIKSILDGTVIWSAWSLETGYSIGIQHANNLVSVYKHNSRLTKEQGNFVKAGDVIATIGGTGLYSTGTHLHFELWFNGSPVDPLDYIIF
jgi:murein DD-endopeptidase MepM/ murein hydrolase activator NlpD